MESLQNHRFDGFGKHHHRIACSVMASFDILLVPLQCTNNSQTSTKFSSFLTIIFYSWSALKSIRLCFDLLGLFEYVLRIKIKKNEKMRMISVFS